MKKTIFITVLALGLILSTTTYAESGKGKEGFLGLFRADDKSSDVQDDDTHADDKKSGEVKVEGSVSERARIGGVKVEDDSKNKSQDDKSREGSSSRDDNKVMTIEARKARATAEIDRRVASLNKLEARVTAMVRVSDATKASLKATIDAQIKVLTDLKAKIAADTDEATLKADIQSITKSYRIYMLVMPQGTILAAADRVATTADLMTTLDTKLDARITDAATAGKDVTALKSASVDLKAKLEVAKTAAADAVTLSATLKPDNGDATIMASNKKAMDDARAKIKVAQDALKAARKDAETIVKGLKDFNIKVEGSLKTETESR